MKWLKELTQSPSRLKMAGILLAVAALALAGAFFVGISDNPPGLLLCLASAVTLVLAFVHHWRRPKRFLLLAAGGLVGFFLFAVLHNLFYAIGEAGAGVTGVAPLMEVLHVASFLIAIFLCPAAALVGVAGGLVTLILSRRNANETA